MTYHNKNLKGIRTILADFGIDIARSYFFSVEIPSLYTGIDKSLITAMCVSSAVPDFTVQTKQLKYQNMDINLANGLNFKPWDINFISDDSGRLRTSLLMWSSSTYDYNRKGSTTPNSYKRKILIKQLSANGSSICEYTLVGAFPTTVGGYRISNDDKTKVAFPVTFHYEYFTVNVNKNTNIEVTQKNNKPPV
jgi:hypothetical protein